MLKAELAEIDALLAKLDKPVKRTAEGIPYYIETCGTGKPLMAHELAQFTGTIATLQGKVLYDYRNSGLQIRLLDHSWPSAMQKVLLGMKKGERRIVYLPSLYAYGLSGDRQKIGSYCSIIINFRLESFR